MNTAGKVFVVTGGGNGIGREVVLGLLARGAKVAAVDLRQDSLDETAQLARAGADRLVTYALDITDAPAVAALPERVAADLGPADGLLNIAGIIQHFVKFADLDRAEIERVLAVNFWGVVNMCQAFLPTLMSRPEARLVNVASMGAFAPVPGQTIYGASKAAVKLLTEGLYAELRGTPVAVTVVFPGAIKTGIAQHSGAAIPGGDAAAMSDKAPPMTEPDVAATQIIRAMQRGDYRLVIGKDAAMLDRLSRLAPQRATDLIAKKMAALLGG